MCIYFLSDFKMNVINNGNCTERSAIWSEIKLVITSRTPASRSCDFVITRLISDQIALRSVPLLIIANKIANFRCIRGKNASLLNEHEFLFVHCVSRQP